MLVGLEERVLQQPHVGGLHGAEHGLQLGLPQPPAGDEAGAGVDAAAAHVDDADHAHARVGLEAVGGEAVVDGMQQAEVAGEADVADGVVLGAQFEDVDGGGEQQRELERRADRREAGGGWVVGREDGDVQRVVLWPLSAWCWRRRRGSTDIASDHAQTGD